MNKKNKDSLWFVDIVVYIVIIIGLTTIIRWIVTGTINAIDMYSNFVERIDNLDARTQYLRNRIEFIDDRLYELDKKNIRIEADGTTSFNNTKCFYPFSKETCLTPRKSIVSDMVFAPR